MKLHLLIILTINILHKLDLLQNVFHFASSLKRYEAYSASKKFLLYGKMLREPKLATDSANLKFTGMFPGPKTSINSQPVRFLFWLGKLPMVGLV